MDELRGLTAEEAALVARFPLPAGVPDALVNKADLAHALRVSEVTIGKWQQRGLPAETEGTNGRAWLFRLSIAFAWVEDWRAREGMARLQAREAAGQLALALTGGTIAHEGGLTSREQRELMDLVILRNRAAREQGELMHRDEVVDLFERAFGLIRNALDALPDRLGRELNLSGADLEAIERACDDALARTAQMVEELACDERRGLV